MRKKILPVLILILAVFPCFPEEPVLGVPGIRGVDVEDSVVEVTRSLVESAFLKTGKFSVLAFADMEEILAAQTLSLSGVFDDETAAQIGQMVSAQTIVHGEIVGFGGSFLLSLRLIDVETGSTKKAELQKIPDMDSLAQEVHELVFRMVDMVYHPDAAADRNIDALTIEDLRNNMVEIVPRNNPDGVFYVSRYEITQGQWTDLGWFNPSHFKDELFPVESVDFDRVIAFCNRLSEVEGFEPVYRRDEYGRLFWDEWKNGYRLPTLDEWTLAAKSGNPNDRNPYPGSRYPNLVAWFADNAASQTHTVGQKAPNTAGLYDMSGNVREYCWSEIFKESEDSKIWWFMKVPTRGGSYSGTPYLSKIETIGRNHERFARGNSGTGFRLVRSGNRMIAAADEERLRRESLVPEYRQVFEEMTARWDMVEVVAPGESVTFTMGVRRSDNNLEKIVHDVTWNQPFSMNCYELTVEDFVTVINYAIVRDLVSVITGEYNKPDIIVFREKDGSIMVIRSESSYVDNPLEGFRVDPDKGMIEVDSSLDEKTVMPFRWTGGMLVCNLISTLDEREPCYNPVYDEEGLAGTVFIASANGFRYPFEAEWELAAKGGSDLKNTKYAGSNSIRAVTELLGEDVDSYEGHWAWIAGQHQPNVLGIHDMSGTIGEYTSDCIYWYSENALINPIAWAYSRERGELITDNPGYTIIDGWDPGRIVKGRHIFLEREKSIERGLRRISSRTYHDYDEWGSIRLTTRTIDGEE